MHTSQSQAMGLISDDLHWYEMAQRSTGSVESDYADNIPVKFKGLEDDGVYLASVQYSASKAANTS